MIHKTSVIFVLSLIAFASALPQLPVSLSSTTQKKTEASNTWTSTTTSGTASSSLIVSDIASASSSGSVWSTATPSSATSGGVDSSSTVWGSATSAAESANTATSTSAWNVGTTTPEATVTSAIGSTGTINSTIATSASIKESTSSSDAWSTATATATSSVSTSASTAATPIPTSAEIRLPLEQIRKKMTELLINYTQPGFEWDIDLGLTIENYKKNSSGFLYELAINGSYVSPSNTTNATIPFACGRRIASSIDIPANASVPISVPTMFYRYNLTLPDPVVSGVISTCGAPHIEGGIIMETSPAIVTSWDVKAKYTVFKAAVEGTVTVPQYKEKEWKGLRVEIPCPDLLREKALTKTCAAEKPKE
ncbi:hypothetical protein BKA69DRAFT_1141594 [Paraphysoderma sedebokerense]|nr:hypothetical protein BKA69DRAFT_1141594 [Paraphysoderma sedebokerense]